MPGLAGRRALVKVSGDPVAFVDDATTNQGDNKTYQVTNAAKRVWHRTNAVTVKIGGVSQPPGGADPYTINRLTGKVIFTNANGGRAAVTVSADYLPMSTASGARQYSFEIKVGIVDDTDFDSANTNGGMPTKLQGLLDFTGSIGKRWRTDEYFKDALLAGNPVLVAFFADRNQVASLYAWVFLERDALQAALEGSVDVEVGMMGTPDAENRVISLP